MAQQMESLHRGVRETQVQSASGLRCLPDVKREEAQELLPGLGDWVTSRTTGPEEDQRQDARCRGLGRPRARRERWQLQEEVWVRNLAAEHKEKVE